jgi:hypothetical protein
MKVINKTRSGVLTRPVQGCQMVYFQTKNTALGTFWKALQLNMLVQFMAIWSILWTFGIFLVNWFWYVVSRKIWQPWSSACF